MLTMIIVYTTEHQLRHVILDSVTEAYTLQVKENVIRRLGPIFQ